MRVQKDKCDEVSGYLFWIDAVRKGPGNFQGRIHVVKLPNTEKLMDEPVVLTHSRGDKDKREAIGIARLDALDAIKYDYLPGLIQQAREEKRKPKISQSFW